MGEALARHRAEAHAKQQDEAYVDALKTNHLFSNRPEVYNTDYPCQLFPGHVVQKGTPVTLKRASTTDDQSGMESPKRIDVIVFNQTVATMQEEPGIALGEIIESDPLSRENVLAEVVAVSSLDDTISVRCVKEHADEKP